MRALSRAVRARQARILRDHEGTCRSEYRMPGTGNPVLPRTPCWAVPGQRCKRGVDSHSVLVRLAEVLRVDIGRSRLCGPGWEHATAWSRHLAIAADAEHSGWRERSCGEFGEGHLRFHLPPQSDWPCPC